MALTPQQLAQGYRQGPYVWPGGYPIYLVLEDGEMPCWECLKTEYPSIVQAAKSPNRTGWEPEGYIVLWETEEPELCAHCSKELESAYGDVTEAS